MATSLELREAAKDERDALKIVQASADLTLAGVAAAAITVAPPVGLIGLIPAVIRWRTMKELTTQERLIEDPPRPDFEDPAEPSFEPVFFDSHDWAGPLTDYVRNSVNLCAYQGAMIASIEKSLGAQERGESGHSRERAKEAGAFAEEARAALLQTADSQSGLRNLVNSGELFEAEEKLRTTRELPERPSTPLEALPDATALWLFHAGASPEMFRTWSSEERLGRHPFMELWRPLYANTVSKRRLAVELVL